MTKNELIKILEGIPDDAPLCMWGPMDYPVPITVADSALIHGSHVTVIVHNTVDPISCEYEGPTVVLDSREIDDEYLR